MTKERKCHNCGNRIPTRKEIQDRKKDEHYFELVRDDAELSIYFCNLNCFKEHYQLKDKRWRKRGVRIMVD